MPSEEELMGLAAHMGMLRVLFQSKTAPMLSPSVTGTAASARLTEMIALHREGKKKKKHTLHFKTKTFLLFHLRRFFSFTPYMRPRCSHLIANRRLYLPYCVEVTICSS